MWFAIDYRAGDGRTVAGAVLRGRGPPSGAAELPVVTSACSLSVAAAFTSSGACAITNDRPATRNIDTSLIQSPTATTSRIAIP